MNRAGQARGEWIAHRRIAHRRIAHRRIAHRRLLQYLADDLFQSVPDWPDEHVAPSLGASDDVVHDAVDVEVDAVLLVMIVHATKRSHGNTGGKAGRPFIPWLKPRGFLASVL